MTSPDVVALVNPSLRTIDLALSNEDLLLLATTCPRLESLVIRNVGPRSSEAVQRIESLRSLTITGEFELAGVRLPHLTALNLAVHRKFPT